jgi:5-methylthioadenosine/S-adenosylhomocysteine deaminase
MAETVPATWLLGGLCLLPEDAGHRPNRRTVEIRSGRIVALYLPESAPTPAPGDTVFDAQRHLISPGLVNAHTHSPDNLIRSSAPDLPLELWSLHSAAGREARTEREITVAALLGAVEMLRTGTTTVLDHIRLSPYPDAVGLNAVASAYQAAGMRAIIAPVVADKPVVETLPFEPADLQPGPVSGYGRGPMMPAAEQIALVDAFIDHWHGVDGRILGAIGPSGPQRCSGALLEGAAELSERRSVLLHTHLLETRAQRAMGFKLYGRGMVKALAERRILSRRANLVHAIWLEPGDIEIIADAGAAIVHNPVSNARLGSGFCRLPAIMSRGVRVALGTDSACCNDSNNLLETVKWAALVHNSLTSDPEHWIGPERALALATRSGADALGLSAVTGAIEPGLSADLTLFRLDAPSFVPLIDPVRQLVMAESGAAVDMVMVAGELVFRDGKCVRVDEDALWAEAHELAQRRLAGNRSVYAAAAELSDPIRRMYRRLDQEERP